MSYQSTVNSVRAAAIAVNPDGRFDHGRHVDFSQGFEGDYPFIYLYPININKSNEPEFVDSNVILLGFFQQDKPDTSNSEREAIIAEMDELSDLFIEELSESKLVRVSGITKEPLYQHYQGTLSGFAVRLTLQNFTAC